MKQVHKMCIFWLTIFFLAGLSSVASAQQSYRFEASADYGQMTMDDREQSSYGLGGQYYFLPVQTRNHPLAEAAFLERIGSIAVTGVMGETEWENVYGSFQYDTTAYDVTLSYARPGQSLALGAKFVKSESTYDSNPYYDDFDTDGYALMVGGYATQGLLLAISYEHSESKYQFNFPSSSMDLTLDTYSFEWKFVKELLNDKAVNFMGALSRLEMDSGNSDATGTGIEISMDYYFNAKVSFGGSFTAIDGDSSFNDAQMYGVRTRIFFSPGFSLYGGYEQVFYDDDDDAEIFNLGVSFRF